MSTMVNETLGDEISLRERNKRKKRLSILDAARTLLIEQGFTATKMDAIADKAEVGVATVYKYFSTKGELITEIARLEIIEMLRQVDAILEQYPSDLRDALILLLTPATEMQLTRKTSLVRYVLEVGWNDRKGNLQAIVAWSRGELLQRIHGLLEKFRATGKYEKLNDLHSVSELIYSIFDYNFIVYSRGQFESIEAMRSKTEQQIGMVVANFS